MFSDSLLTWTDARDECNLYGGFLLHISDIKEQNCLLRYGLSQGFNSWYWTDGIKHISVIFYFISFAVNDIENKGIYVSASNSDQEVTWFSPKLKSGGAELFAGDAILLNISPTLNNGAWCDVVLSAKSKFICEALI